MSMQFRDIATRAGADGAISPEEILALRREGWGDGKMSPEEVEALFVANDMLREPSREWSDFFVEAVGEYIVNQLEPRGYVTPEQASWLVSRISHDGKLDSISELELLVRVLERAQTVPDSLRAFALEQVEAAVLTGEGPTRAGGALDKGCVNAAEAQLLRRIIFASGSERPAAVSRTEAELLFRIKDATLGAANAPEWKRLFVQGVGNYLRGFSSHTALTRECAAELESFMDNSRASLVGFMLRMARSDISKGLREVFGKKAPARDLDSEAAAAGEVTQSEQLWLQDRIDANDQLDEYDQALLDFLAEED